MPLHSSGYLTCPVLAHVTAQAVELAVTKLLEFVQSDDQNLKYLGLLALAKLQVRKRVIEPCYACAILLALCHVIHGRRDMLQTFSQRPLPLPTIPYCMRLLQASDKTLIEGCSDAVLKCLEDEDIAVRSQALLLVAGMVSRANLAQASFAELRAVSLFVGIAHIQPFHEC